MSTALYRRYRPETFADVIGQEHVTDPLRAALRGDRITHAYLFSGPRGCGKTTSARIFARCLNCAEGPTDTPCGSCDSCVELARDGAGSLDVVEMDAASHGGVDDARELRERAAFAPARDRYKVFIIDEAHMVTSQGFNALLKLVEEPPAHVKFVFATTEPEKVIGTIRSRTHHYPFRLVPPERLQGYLEELCTAEGVRVASGVLPLVVRAGGGSVRDSLSVLDQLIAGAEDGEVNYERAVSLLGYTHATLLDDVVDALAARDGGSLFRVVDRVIDSGHDPRRFAEDLLERLRDLVVIAVSGDQASAVLRSLSADQFERMRVQSRQLGPAELSRAGDLVNDALTEMSGATSPRLQLELMCARLLLPGADDASRGHSARLDRIERHLSAGPPPSRETAPSTVASTGSGQDEGPVAPQDQSVEEARPAAASGSTPGDQPTPTSQPAEPPAATRQATEAPAPEPTRQATAAPAPEPTRQATEAPAPEPTRQPTEAPAPQPIEPVATPAPSPAQPPAPASGDGELIRRRWSEVLATLARFKRSTWALVSQNAQVGDVSGGVLHLAFATSGLAHTFRTGAHDEPLQRALVETLGVRVRIEPVLSQGAESGSPASSSGEPAAAAGWGDPGPAAPPADAGGYQPPPAPGPDGASATTGGATAGAGAAASPADAPGSWSAQSPGEPPARPQDAPSPPEGSQRPRPGTPNPGRGGLTGSAPAGPTPPVTAAPAQPVAVVPLAEDTPSMDDPDAENSGLVGAPLIEQMLGGTIISEEERS